jgi:hypothetical protein
MVCDATDPTLAACYRFESSTKPTADESQYGNSGIDLGVTVVPGFDGNALQTAANSLVLVGDSPSLDVPLLTIELWFRADAMPTTRGGLFDNQGQYGFFLLSTGELWCSAGLAVGQTAAVVSPMTWTHAACTYDGANLIIYVDGVALTNVALAGAIDTTGVIGSAIGSHAPFGENFVGLIDNLRVWRVARSPQQICQDAHACVP